MPVLPHNAIDTEQIVDEILAAVAAMADEDDPLHAELTGATVLAAMADSTLAEEFVSQVEGRGGPGALALLLAVSSVGSGTHDEIAEAATAGAERLAAAGVPIPRLAAHLAEPLESVEHRRLQDRRNTLSVLVGSFRRAGRGHAFVIIVDHGDCGAASEIFFTDPDQLPELLDGIREDCEIVRTEDLDPAELRWYVEDALDARAVHDEENPFGTLAAFDSAPLDEDEEGPPHQILATLVRSRLLALPPARKPHGARGHHEGGQDGMLAALRGGPSGMPGIPTPAKLPPKRKKSDGPAPIYQVKISLRGAKPPIWRRLLVPADVSLARLHDIIQVAFGWDGSHLHAFHTPYGLFGRADRDLGHRAEKPVTLEQVAPQAKDKIRYVYDFGDDWTHEIQVEKLLVRDPTLTYPRCVGGRRAAPPDDCGGIWGYEELVRILADPRHPDHQERLEWLGLADASHFDPAAFDPDEVSRALAKPR